MIKSVKALMGTVALLCATSVFADVTSTVTVTNNYLWRGLSQSMNNPAVQGGVEVSSGDLYAGTWVSNVEYADNDPFSYENDWYFGKTGTVAGLTYDVGYLYYNYDKDANFDFSEVYGTLSFDNIDLSLYVLAHTEADEAAGQDFGFGQATYMSANYTVPVSDGTDVILHVGRHDGDFVTAFNGTPNNYTDYSVAVAKNGFEFKVSNTNLDNDTIGAPNNNDKVRFVASYTISI